MKTPVFSIPMRYFLEVADCGSVNQAAERLFVAASAVSRQVSKLEDSLGAPLFERRMRRMVLTPAGLRLQAHLRAGSHLAVCGQCAAEVEAQGWDTLWNATAFKGQVSILDTAPNLCGMYFWANGINWTTEDPADLDACEAFLVDEFAQHIKGFDSYPSTAIAEVAGKRILCAPSSSRRKAISLLAASEPAGYSMPA